MRMAILFLAFGLLTLSPPASGDDYLMFGPSLAVFLEQECEVRGACRFRDVHGNGRGGGFEEDESHFAMDAGHNVTIVDDLEWSSMTTEEFAAFDAIVIGDAGCEFDDGERLQTLVDTRAEWSPAVTGHLFLHTFDNVYHYMDGTVIDEEMERGGYSMAQLDAMVDLAVDGMEFAASAGSTGLYYANGCRSLHEDGGDPDRGSEISSLEFLADLASVSAFAEYSGDDAMIQVPGHPSMANLDDGGLSDWGSSFHALWESYGSEFQLIAIGGFRGRPGRGPEPEDPEFGDIIIATRLPLSGSASVLPIPSAGAAGLMVFALLLGALGWLVVARRF